jgi:hypothetical protein
MAKIRKRTWSNSKGEQTAWVARIGSERRGPVGDGPGFSCQAGLPLYQKTF